MMIDFHTLTCAFSNCGSRRVPLGVCCCARIRPAPATKESMQVTVLQCIRRMIRAPGEGPGIYESGSSMLDQYLDPVDAIRAPLEHDGLGLSRGDVEGGLGEHGGSARRQIAEAEVPRIEVHERAVARDRRVHAERDYGIGIGVGGD